MKNWRSPASMRISSGSGWWNSESLIFRRKSNEKRWLKFLSMPFSCTMTGCCSRSTTRMAPKPSVLRTLWRLIAEKKVCVCEATKAPVGLLSNRTVLRKQDGGALPRQVRICPALLGQKSNDLTLEIVGFFFFVCGLTSFGFDHNFDHNAGGFIWSN